MTFFTEIHGQTVLVLAIRSKPYPQAPEEIEILSVTDETGRNVPTTTEENERIRNEATNY